MKSQLRAQLLVYYRVHSVREQTSCKSSLCRGHDVRFLLKLRRCLHFMIILETAGGDVNELYGITESILFLNVKMYL